MRTIETHKVNPANDILQITVLDQPGPGGACHRYLVDGFNTRSNLSAGGTYDAIEMLFQNGPIAEHFHAKEPKDVVQQAIHGCFPLVEGFLKILELDAAKQLGDAWKVMLEEEQFFSKKKAEADGTFAKLPWGASLNQTEDYACPKCGSSYWHRKTLTTMNRARLRAIVWLAARRSRQRIW